MKIACLVSSLSRNAGGVHDSVRRLCQTLHAHASTEVHVFGTSDEHTHLDLPSWSPVRTHAFSVLGPRQFGFAPGLKETLFALDADILLTNGLWMYSSVVALAWHRRTGRPFIMHPHGMLEPWATRRRPLKKRFMSFLNENACLGEAACIRALTTLEANAIRARGLLNPVCVLPNGMDVPEAGREAHPAWRDKVPIGKNILLYLGRIHPKKGLPDLLRAWHLLREEGPVTARNWHLVIAGWNQDGHEDELRQLVSLMGLCASVHFVGPQFGRDKSATYQAATAFVLPSLSEGLPMTVLEAWAHRLPVLMTPECNLLEAFEAKAALGAEPNISGLAQGLETLFGLDALDRKRMADRAYDLMKERFSWNIIGAQMHDVCRWLLGEIEQPACVSARAAALASA